MLKVGFMGTPTNSSNESNEMNNVESLCLTQESGKKREFSDVAEVSRVDLISTQSNTYTQSLQQPHIPINTAPSISTSPSSKLQQQQSYTPSSQKDMKSSARHNSSKQSPENGLQLPAHVLTDPRFLKSTKQSCLTFFHITEDTFLDIIHDKNAQLRKAFYGDLVMKSIAAAEIWTTLGIEVTPEVMQLKRSHYESNFHLALFLLYGTDFKDICNKYRIFIRRNNHSLGSILEAFLWESNPRVEKSIYRLEEWKDVGTDIMRWIDMYVEINEDNRTVAQGLASIFDLQDNPKAFTSISMARDSVTVDGFSIYGGQSKASHSVVQSQSVNLLATTRASTSSGRVGIPVSISMAQNPSSSSGSPKETSHYNHSVVPSAAQPYVNPHITDYEEGEVDEDEANGGNEEDTEGFNDRASYAPSVLTTRTYVLHSLTPNMHNEPSMEVVLSKEHILANMSSWNSAVFNRHIANGEVYNILLFN